MKLRITVNQISRAALVFEAFFQPRSGAGYQSTHFYVLKRNTSKTTSLVLEQRWGSHETRMTLEYCLDHKTSSLRRRGYHAFDERLL